MKIRCGGGGVAEDFPALLLFLSTEIHPKTVERPRGTQLLGAKLHS